ncbi:site-specific integrase [Neorhodopirellula pilleata]|uniref:Site-specific tyrosine recombinase XerC n=1 Tax=Neorhodopirellula pilleata TaxID=2714738 RepID=A0A5C6A8J1_9BACT|nr:site-specific integrase [Neorhodopirellula pilleata]TWT95776.1 site-specific tyrosine recombinase XerC [Neorhodopirellula pilleata]
MRVPKYSRHSSGKDSSRDQARVRLGGHTYYLGVYGSKESRAEYKRLVAEFIANDGVIVRQDARADLSLTELFASYLVWARKHYGKSATEFDKIKRIVKRTRLVYGDLEASRFGYQQFEVIRTALLNDGVGRDYINGNMDRLVRVFRWGASRNLIEPSVAQSLGMIERLKRGRTNAPERKPVPPVPADVVLKTLPHLSSVVSDMIRLQMVVGSRPGELCNLTPAMIDRTGDVWEATLIEHKTAHHGKSRTLFIGPQGQAILSPYLMRFGDEHCFRPVDAEKERRDAQHAARKTPLSCGDRPGTNRKRAPKVRPGQHYTTASYRRAIHRACDMAFPAPSPLGRLEGESDRARLERLNPSQIKQLRKWQAEHRWNPNQLRHTFATDAWKTEEPEAVQILLGHSDLRTTLVYAERDRRKAIDAARRVG